MFSHSCLHARERFMPGKSPECLPCGALLESAPRLANAERQPIGQPLVPIGWQMRTDRPAARPHLRSRRTSRVRFARPRKSNPPGGQGKARRRRRWRLLGFGALVCCNGGGAARAGTELRKKRLCIASTMGVKIPIGVSTNQVEWRDCGQSARDAIVAPWQHFASAVHHLCRCAVDERPCARCIRLSSKPCHSISAVVCCSRRPSNMVR
jgi:hypothetical protein